MRDALVALPLGLAIGLLLGLLGGGGSILAVPALVYLLDFSVRDATATSLLVVGLTALVGAGAHARRGGVDLRTGLAFGAGSVPGAVAGSILNRLASPASVLFLFALVLLATAAAMLRPRPQTAAPPRSGGRALAGAGAFGLPVGVLTGFFGVGGGFAIVPTLVLGLRLRMARAVGTSLVVIALSSAAGLATHLVADTIPWSVALAFTGSAFAGAAVAGTLAGTALGGRFSPLRLRQAFGLFLVAIAAFLLWKNATAFG